jgi:hypothetical protein
MNGWSIKDIKRNDHATMLCGIVAAGARRKAVSLCCSALEP